MNVSDVLRKAFDPKTQFKRNPVIDSRYSSEDAVTVEIEVKHRKTGVYNCYVECEFKDDILEARLVQAESVQRPGEWATRSAYLNLQAQIDKMHDHLFILMRQGAE